MVDDAVAVVISPRAERHIAREPFPHSCLQKPERPRLHVHVHMHVNLYLLPPTRTTVLPAS